MKILKETGPNGEISYTIELMGTENANFKSILEGWLDALEYHELKSHDYSERDEPGVWNLGLKGEWPGVTRKMQKLHKIVWKGKDVLFEGGQEIMMDLMGAIGLMLHEQRKISDKYSASWRNNSSSKPTFGPGPRDGFRSGKISEVHIFPKHDHEFINGRCIICTIPRTTEATGIEHVHKYIGLPSACICGKTSPGRYGE